MSIRRLRDTGHSLKTRIVFPPTKAANHLLKKPPTKDEVDAAVEQAPSTDDETELANSVTKKVEPQL